MKLVFCFKKSRVIEKSQKLISLEQFIRTVNGQKKFWTIITFNLATCSNQIKYIGTIKIPIGTNTWNVETYRNKLENKCNFKDFYKSRVCNFEEIYTYWFVLFLRIHFSDSNIFRIFYKILSNKLKQLKYFLTTLHYKLLSGRLVRISSWVKSEHKFVSGHKGQKCTALHNGPYYSGSKLLNLSF